MSLVVESSSEMNAGLAELTCAKLSAFRWRRRSLAVQRGVARSACVALAVLVIAIGIDAWFVHTAARYVAAGAFYVLMAIVFYPLVLRRLWVHTSLIDEARLFEHADTNLRELLLPAVELADSNSTGQGSLAFCAKLQSQVADALRPVDIEELLPWQMIRGSMRVAALCLALFVGACFLPNLFLIGRAARILLPAANLGRVSNVALSVERPLPQSKTVPAGDLVAVTAKVVGRLQGNVLVETRGGAQTRTIEMLRRSSPAPGSRRDRTDTQYFEAMLSADLGGLEYRVTADGAYTPWYRLTAVQRPSVTSFAWTVHAPSYSSLGPQTSESDHGNLSVLHGSRVELEFDVNVPLSRAELNWGADAQLPAPDRVQSVTPLHRNPRSGRWAAAFDVERDRSFRISLHGESTGLTNEFSPAYRVEAIEDLPPRLRWTSPSTTSIVAAAHDSLALALQVHDEMPLRAMRGEFRINSGQWESFDLTEWIPETHIPATGSAGVPSAIAWSLDLSSYGLASGDRFELVVVATDAKGQDARSDALGIAISKSDLQFADEPVEQLRLQIADRLEHLQVTAGQLAARETTAAGAGIDSQIEQLLSFIEHSASLTPDAVFKTELRYTGNALGRLRMQIPLAESAESLPVEVAQGFAAIATHFRTCVSQDVVSRCAFHVAELAELQRLLEVDSTESEISVMRLSRRQSVIGLQLQSLQQTLLDSIEQTREATGPSLRQTADMLAAQVMQIEREEGKANLRMVQHNAASVAAVLNHLSSSHAIDPSLSEAVERSHRELAALAGAAEEPVAWLAKQFAAGIAENAITESPRQALATRRAIARMTHIGISQLARDLGSAKRAMDNVVRDRNAGIQEKSASLDEITRALRVLEGVDAAQQAKQLLQALHKREATDVQTAANAAQSLGLWQLCGAFVEQAENSLRFSQVSPDWVERLSNLVRDNTSNTITNQLRSRVQLGTQEFTLLNRELLALVNESTLVVAELANHAAAARALLEKFSPAISLLAQRAANETKQLAEQSLLLSDSLQRQQVPDPNVRLSQLRLQLSHVGTGIEDLRDALVDLADGQDLLNIEQIETARRADAALGLVNAASDQVRYSLEHVHLTDTPMQQATGLQLSAAHQAQAAEVFANLVEQFQADQRLDVSTTGLDAAQDSQWTEGSSEGNEPQDDAHRGNEFSAEYDKAKALAELAEANPEEVLRQLEQQLKSNPPMQQELSDIARRAVERSLVMLESAKREQRGILPLLERSDPELQTQAELLKHDLMSVRWAAAQWLNPLHAEIRWTATAGRLAADPLEQLTQQQTRLAEAVATVGSLEDAATFDESLFAAGELAEALRAVESVDRTLHGSLVMAAQTEMHANSNEREQRRREMQDRQRRIEQILLRQARESERLQRERLQRAESELRDAPRRVEELSRGGQTPLDQPLALAQATLQAMHALQASLRSRVEAAQRWVTELAARPASELAADNPSAELAGNLAQQAAESSAEFAAILEIWALSPREMRASESALSSALERQAEVRDEVDAAAQSLARAERHERRLENLMMSERLQTATHQAERVVQEHAARSQSSLAAALDSALEGHEAGSADAGASQAAIEASESTAVAIEATATGIRTLLDASAETSQPDRSAGEPPAQAELPDSQLLDAQALAQLLDELDQQLESQQSLGEKEDDSQGNPSGSPPHPTPTPLTEAAQQLAENLSRSRQPPASTPSSDIGMATDPKAADATPQAPVDVRIVDINRVDGDWGELRGKSAEETRETRRDAISPLYRRQIDAYFREIARRDNALGK